MGKSFIQEYPGSDGPHLLDSKHVSTSYVERQKLTMRMQNGRFTRLTNAFSKRIDHHVAAFSLSFMYVNFVRIHQTLRCTLAMAAGVTDRLWDMSETWWRFWTANGNTAFRPDPRSRRVTTSGPTIPPGR